MNAGRVLRRLPLEWWGLTAIALATRFWRLSVPTGRVWDEVYFQDHASRYFTGSYFFDVHPPLTKLLFALSAWLLRVPSEQFAGNAGITAFRVVPAFCGALLIPAMWWLLRELGASRRVAAFGAAMLLLDNALLVQSRFALMDAPLVLFGVAAVACALSAQRLEGRARWTAWCAAALLAGCAAATKWTGLTALGLIGAAWVVDRLVRGRRDGANVAAEGALLMLLPAVVYVGAFVVHLRLLPNDGPGVVAMSAEFAATRRGNAAYRADAAMSTAAQIVEIHRKAMQTNMAWSDLRHVAASKWYTWPVSRHRIMVWEDSARVGGREARIDIQGNPALWYGVLVLAAVWLVMLALGRASAGAQRDSFVLLGAGYVMNFVPFAFISRPMYLYHYETALVYSVAFASLAAGRLFGWSDDASWPWGHARGRGWFVGLLAIIGLSFVYFAPLSYGTPLSASAAAQRRWVLERQ